MTIKEMLEAKQKELKALEGQIQNGDTEAIEKGAQLADEIKELKGKIEAAEKAVNALKSIGGGGNNEDAPEKEEKGLHAAIKSMDMASLKEQKGVIGVNVKANTDVASSTTEQTYDHNVVDPQVALNVRQIFGQESISTNALTYYVLGAIEGTIGTVAEGATKPQINIPYTPKTAALSKIAAYFKETDELLLDNPFLESAIRNRGIYEFNKVVENYLITTLLGTSGVQTGGTTIDFDTILAAKQDIMADTGYTADALVINPADYATLLQSKDQNKQYLLGGPAYGSYGNGSYSSNPRIWGLTVVESAAMTQGKAVVGAYKAGASVVTKAGEGFRVEVSNSNEDDFINNRVTVRLEERLLEVVRVPAAFSIIGQ